MFWRKKLALIAIIFFILIVGLSLIVYGSFLLTRSSKQQSFSFDVISLSTKPRLEGRVVFNPDFNFSEYGKWLPQSTIPEDCRYKGRLNETFWKGDGFVVRYLDERYSVVIIHPVDKQTGRYIEQTVFLPKNGKNYYLVFGISNRADTLGPAECSDNIFKLVVIDKHTNKTYTLFQESINSKDGWKDFAINISKFAGKEITIILESLAGGPCGEWRGEWGAVDYVDVLTYLPQ